MLPNLIARNQGTLRITLTPKHSKMLKTFLRKRYKNPKNTRVFLRRVPVQPSKLRSKVSYPLLFTNDIAANKLKKPQIDRSLRSFFKYRFNKRLRRLKKSPFIKIKKRKKYQRTTKRKLHHQLKHLLRLSLTKRFRLRSLYARIKRTKPTLIRQLKRIKLSNTLLDTRSERKLTSRRIKNRRRRRVSLRKLRCPSKMTPACRISSSKLLKYAINKSRKVTNRSQTRKATKFALPNSKPRTTKSVIQRIIFNLLDFAHDVTRVRNTSTFIDYDHKAPLLIPRTKKNFIFKNFGMFLNSFLFLNQRNPYTYKYHFKKKIFSFLYPNEVRNYLMNRKKRIIFYKLVYKLKHKSKKRPHYTFSNYNKSVIDQYRTDLANKSNYALTSQVFSSRGDLELRKSRDPLLYRNYSNSTDEIVYEENFKYRGIDRTFKISEVKIPRIRFRPGYQRM